MKLLGRLLRLTYCAGLSGQVIINFFCMDIIKAENITKRFTNHTALDDVSVSIPEGCIYGLLGPNGAGKTTLIRIINHITAPDSGTVTFDGHPLTADDVAHIGYLPEERGLYKKMKVGDQALFFAKLKGLRTREAMAELKIWFERFGIMDWWGKKVEELSKGMAQKVQFIVTVLHRPKLLIFDEPFSGFDPINAELLKNEILRLRDEGATVIFSTHNMESVETLCAPTTSSRATWPRSVARWGAIITACRSRESRRRCSTPSATASRATRCRNRSSPMPARSSTRSSR